MFKTQAREDGHYTFTLLEPVEGIKFQINNKKPHNLDLDVGDSVDVYLDQNAELNVFAGDECIQEITGVVDVDIESKILTLNSVKNRYINGETWILEFENEVEQVLSNEDL